jgi:hypothetical protein
MGAGRRPAAARLPAGVVWLITRTRRDAKRGLVDRVHRLGGAPYVYPAERWRERTAVHRGAEHSAFATAYQTAGRLRLLGQEGCNPAD